MSSSEGEEDSITPRHSPLIMPSNCLDAPSLIRNNNSEQYVSNCQNIKINELCFECNLSSRRNPITCENDLYHRIISNCKHEKQQTLRSSSALTFLEHSRKDLNETAHQPPPKLTNTLNSNRKEVLRPVACKPIMSGSRFYEGPGPTNKLSERPLRHGSEINFGRSNGSLNTQRFGGSLCNVLPSADLCLRREVSESVSHVNEENAFPLARYEAPNKFLINRPWNGTKSKVDLNKLSKYSDSRTVQSTSQLNVSTSNLTRRNINVGHSYQLPHSENQENLYSNEEIESTLTLRRELNKVKSQLEEAKWILCQRTGENELLKSRLKDSKGDQMVRCNEIEQLRATVKDLNSEISTLRAQLSQAVLSFRSKERENVVLKQKLDREGQGQYEQKNELEENAFLRKRINELELKYSMECSKWESQRKKWIEEQKRVLRYQKALQHNYLLTCQKAQTLAAQVESFSSISV